VNPEAWIGLVTVVATIIGAIIAVGVPIWVRVGNLTVSVEILGEQLRDDRDEHLRMWNVLDKLPVVTTQIESLMQKVDGLIQADRERLVGCAEHATRLKTFDNRLSDIAQRRE